MHNRGRLTIHPRTLKGAPESGNTRIHVRLAESSRIFILTRSARFLASIFCIT
jgi:hypothetical protein